MADYETPHSTQQREESLPARQPAAQNDETGWSMALKSILWFILIPAAVVFLVRWLLQL